MKNLIYFHYHHMLNIALTVREFYSNSGEDTVIISPVYLDKTLLELGLIRDKDYVLYPDISRIYDGDDINIVVHHYDYSISKVGDIYSQLSNNIGTVYVSFFADGYTNIFLNAQLREKLFSDNVNFIKRDLIAFDVLKPYYKESCGFEIKVVSSFFFIKALDVYSSVVECFRSKIREVIPCNPSNVAVLCIRPWGSESFNNGMLADEDGLLRFSNALIDFVKSCVLSTDDGVVFFRGDNRDGDYSKAVFESVKKVLGGRLISLDDFVPNNLNFDPFLNCLMEEFKGLITLCSFDSTLPLPFIFSNGLQKCLIGFPAQVLRDAGFSEKFLNDIGTKISNITQDISASNAHGALLNIDETYVVYESECDNA